MKYFFRFFSLQMKIWTTVPLFFICFDVTSLIASPGLAEIQQPSSLYLDLNKKEGVKLLYSNMLISPSAGGRFIFFKRRLNGARDKIFKGPSYKKKEAGFQTNNNQIIFFEKDFKTGALCQIRYSYEDNNEIRISFKFTAPEEFSSLSFEILTLLADIFSGNQIEAVPVAANDAKRVSIEAMPKDERFLLKGKRKVLLHGNICDMEIIDLDGSNSINLADFREINWAKNKGLYLYATKNVMVPGKEYKFQYAIRTHKIRQKKTSKIIDFNNCCNQANSFLNLPPKTEILRNEKLYIKGLKTIYGKKNRAAEIILQKELSKNGIKLKISNPKEKQNKPGIHIKKIEQDVSKFSDLLEDGFELNIQKDGIRIFGTNERGCINGVYALIDKFSDLNDKLYVPYATVEDWPAMKYRGICMSSDFMPGLSKSVQIYKRYLEAVSLCRGNVVIFYHKPIEILKWIKGEEDKLYWSFDEMQEISDYARFLGLDVWAGMVGKFDKEKLPQMSIKSGSNFYNPEKKSSYQFLFSLYDKLIDLYKPSHFLIGHDEIKGLNLYAEVSHIASPDLLEMDLKKLHKWFSQKDIKMLMWGDMLLDNEQIEFEPANSNSTLLNSGPTHLAINDIPKDIKIIDWHYNVKRQYKSIAYFRNNGFEVLGASYHAPVAACSMVDSLKEFDGQGMLATNFGFWRTLSPSATTLYALVCAWTGQNLSFDALQLNKDVKFLRRILSGEDYKKWKTMTPIDLTTICNNSTWDNKPNDGTGLFDIGPYLDLRGLPTGNHTIEGLSFYLPPAKKGMDKNCITLHKGENGRSNPTYVLQGENKIDAIAFLHTAYSKKPNFDLKKVGEYIFEYADDEEAKIDIICGWNITDIRSDPGIRSNRWSFYRSPDELIGSKIAWRGNSLADIPLNLQIFIAENPFPEKAVKRVKFKTDDKDNDSIIALLAMTILNQS